LANDFERISLNATYELDPTFDSERFIKLRLRICHDGKNLNSSSFTCDGFEKAKPSLANTPILAHVVCDDDGEPDFGAHDIELEKIGDGNEFRIRYLEQPIGVIPADCNYEVKEFEGRNYVYADGFCWREYCSDSAQIIERDQTVNLSMEIEVNEGRYEKSTSTYHILDYKYLGVTLLGKDKSPGMVSAAATTTFSKDTWFSMLDELKSEIEYYSIEKEGKVHLNKDRMNEILAEYNLKLEDLDFEVAEDMTEEDFKAKLDAVKNNESYAAKFAATWNQKRDAVQNALDPIVVRDENGDLVSETWYWVCDMDDNFAYVNRHIWNDRNVEDDTGRFAYSFDESAMTAQITSEFERMIVRWLTEDENAKLDASRTAFEQLQSDFDAYKADYSTPNTEVEALRKFQDDRLSDDHKCEVDAVLDEFVEIADNAEFVTLKTNAYTFEDMDALREKCFAIVGKVNRAQFAAKPTQKPSLIKIPIDQKTPEFDPYPGADAMLSK